MKKFLIIHIFYLISVFSYATQYESNIGVSYDFLDSYSGYPLRVGQTFTVGNTGTNESFVLDSILLYTSLNDCYIEIYATSGGLPTGSAISTTVSKSFYDRHYIMSPVALQPSTMYAIVIYTLGATGSPLEITEGNEYTGGEYIRYNGSTWSYSDYLDEDIRFSTYGKHAPIITTQPVALTRCVGTSATFSVAVDSDSPTYQWRKGGSNISGATSSSYTIASVVSGSAGNYDCVVTESLLGTTTTSSTATLTVPTTTSITSQPSSISRCVGTSATFSVTASGTSLTYQWKKDGSNISGATSTSYTISSVATGDAGNYTVTVTGTCGTVASSIAVLTVNSPPSITDHPDNLSICEGDNAMFSVVSSGDGLSYQWRKNSSNISGATNSSYIISGVLTDDAGSYDVAITNTCGSTTSNSAILTIGATSSNSPLKDPTWHWSLDNTLIDSMLTGDDLTAYDNATYSTTKAVGSHSGLLDGGNDYFKTPTIDLTDTVTISMWFRTNSTVSDAKVLFSCSDSLSLTDNFKIYLYTPNIWKIRVGSSNVVTPSGTFNVGQFHHIVVSVITKPTETVIRSWFDGNKCTFSGNDSTVSQTWQTQGRFNIGVDEYINFDWYGFVDEILIFQDFIPNEAQVDSLNDLTYKDTFVPCGSSSQSYGRKKILLAGKLRNIVLNDIERDFGSVVIPQDEGTDTIQYYLSLDYENAWTSTTVQNQDSLERRIPVTIHDQPSSKQSIVDVGGDHNHVWRTTIPINQQHGLYNYIHLGDTATDLYYQYDQYLQSDFNPVGLDGNAIVKFPGGFRMGNCEGLWSSDTVTKSGIGADMGQVTAYTNPSGLNMIYYYDQLHTGYSQGSWGTWPIPKGYWITVTKHLRVNTPGKADGFTEVYVDGVMVAKTSGLKYRSLSQGEDFGKIEGIKNSFHFGGTSACLSPQTQYLQMDNLLVYQLKPGAKYYHTTIGNIGDKIPIYALPASELVPDDLLHDETYTNVSDTIYDVGNNRHYIYNPPNKRDPIYKTVVVPSGGIGFKFLIKEFGWSPGESSTYVKVYAGTKDDALLYTFGIASGQTYPASDYWYYINSSSISNSVVTFEIYIGYSNYDKRGIAIEYIRD